ncbi:hypothetical protein ACFUIY_40455 [Streptomyces griseorubiginosus]|uniref:hypothetical protein n=1 Tax=Streptomyces griseorubiginosus TaxID=67304 RepID=UPI0011400733|nr:hypothetical protein [Streptomyces griseorubiginosus]
MSDRFGEGGVPGSYASASASASAGAGVGCGERRLPAGDREVVTAESATAERVTAASDGSFRRRRRSAQAQAQALALALALAVSGLGAGKVT